jgi:3D (Asp-Asp-Asp) domain-containing protein
MEIIKIFIVTATIYHAVPAQTDSTPFITASGAVIEECCAGTHRWIAVSRDLEDEGLFFGAKVYVTGTGVFDGIWTVQDRMNKRWTRRIDFLVDKDVTGGKWEDVEVRLLK